MTVTETAPATADGSDVHPVDDAPLVAEGVSVRFGGLQALDGVSVRVDRHEIVGLIGGNGAGKTTFMDCVSGYVRPHAGSIRTRGQELVGLEPAARPYLGVGRSYQDARLFPGLTVEETLLVMHERHQPSGLLSSLLGLAGSRRAEAAKRERVDLLIETMGLVPYREKRVAELSTGTRRVVDLASILAQGPELLLLDEPTAGLAQRETEAFGPLLKRVQERLDCSILLIEHDMVLVASVSDRIYALESGRVIAEGEPAAVQRHPAVVASYLGTDLAAINRSGAAPAGDRDRGRLRSLTRSELLDLAGEAGIPGRHRLRKDDLVERLAAG